MLESKKKTAEKVVEDAVEEGVDGVANEKELEEKTATRLEEAFSDKAPADPDSEDEESTPDETPADDEVDEEDESTPEEKAEEEKIKKEREDEGVEAEAKEEEPDKDDSEEAPQLSDAYYRAAIHRGWNEDEVKEFWSANPKLAEKTFAKIYEAVNRSSEEFAEIGRVRKDQLEHKAEPEETTVEATKRSDKKLGGVDIEKLRTEYPDDPVVDMVEAMQTQNQALYDEMQVIKNTKPPEQSQEISQSEVAAIQQQIEGFFNGGEAELYGDFYGTVQKGATDWSGLAPGEKANRWAVIQMADEMIIGAESFSRELPRDEAMRLAHMSVTESIREKVIRADIMGQVVKRSKSLSLKPSSAAKPDSGSAPKDEAELESRTEERLSKLF